MDYSRLTNLSEEELSNCDIAELNLLAAKGLPATAEFDVHALCRKVDDWSEIVDHSVRRSIKRRLRGEASDLTGDQFRVMVMITVLQRNLGVTYNLKFSEGEYDGRDSRNLFLHGLLTDWGGTCVTMPVLYCAIGRRLGWPLKLVFAKEHVFCRWDEGPTSTFNIEATASGLVIHSDHYYQHRPRPLTSQEIESGWFLRSLTPREELAFFISNRGTCQLEHLAAMFAADEFLAAMQLVPNHLSYRACWQMALAVHQAIKSMRDSPRGPTVHLPAPRSADELAIYNDAAKNLWRILRNRGVRPSNDAELRFSFTT